LLIVEPADELTLDKPSEAFEVTLDAVSLALDAVSEAFWVACDVVEALRRTLRRTTN
jgi:hypothetical protein